VLISSETVPSLQPGARRSLMAGVSSTLQLLRLYWWQDRIGTLFMAFHAVLLPLLVFYFAFRIAPGRGPAFMRLLAGGMAAGAGIGVVSSVGYGMLADVQLGRLALLRASGVAKATYFSAHLIGALVLSMLSSAFSLALLCGLGVISTDAVQLGAAILAALATGAASCGLGAFVAVTAADLATGRDRLSLASAGLAFLSPVFYQASDLPALLRVLVWGSPFTHAAVLNRAVLSGAALPVANLAAIILLGAALNVTAFRGLRWR
jgi:ABC-type polysaccharide/polyol phosphate export permease